jgi:rare lipoprotein A (peptidoglycan hydrolase)
VLKMENTSLLEEIQEKYKKAQDKPRKPKKSKADLELERINKIKSVKRKIILALVLILAFVSGVAYAAERYVDWRAGHQWQFPITWIGFVKEIEEPEVEVLAPVEFIEEKESWVGKVSWYGSGTACLGCDPNEIMANGQKFDENAMTLAFNRLPLNTKVRVTNLDNGANTIATVTDTGGFEALGRIADLSKGLMQELNAITDVSNIKIEVL